MDDTRDRGANVDGHDTNAPVPGRLHKSVPPRNYQDPWSQVPKRGAPQQIEAPGIDPRRIPMLAEVPEGSSVVDCDDQKRFPSPLPDRIHPWTPRKNLFQQEARKERSRDATS